MQVRSGIWLIDPEYVAYETFFRQMQDAPSEAEENGGWPGALAAGYEGVCSNPYLADRVVDYEVVKDTHSASYKKISPG